MKPGPPPVPTNLRLLHGNPGHRPLPQGEPKPRADKAPSCPRDLTADAKKVWRKLVPELRALGLLTVLDGELLSVYCQTYADWLHYRKQIVQYGDMQIIRNDDGTPKYMQQSPYVGMANRAVAILKSYAAEFGFSPASRTRISVMPPEVEKDPFEVWIAGGGKVGK